ncbi:hypothetical protein V8E51_002273 [Hyaloscypha variabilis]
MLKKAKEKAMKKLSSTKGSGSKDQAHAGPSQAGQPQADPSQSGYSHSGRDKSHAGPSQASQSLPDPSHKVSSHPGPTLAGGSTPADQAHSRPPSHTGRQSETEKPDPFQETIDNWPPSSVAHDNGKIHPHEYYGVSAANPDKNVSQEPLNWRVVSKLPPEERKRQIVARMNFFTQASPWAFRLPQWAFDFFIKRALDAGKITMAKPPRTIKLDREKVLEFEGWDKHELILADAYKSCRMNAACILPIMMDSIRKYQSLELSHRLALFLTNNISRQLPCKKVVAFGAGAMSYARPIEPWKGAGTIYPDLQPLRCQIQHAAVISIHDLLERRLNRKLPLYLQDPFYVEEDAKAAKHFKMAILNPEFGYQEGWVELDEETFFIDASILPFDKEKAIYSYTIMNTEKLDESNELIPRETMEYPGIGLQNWSATYMHNIKEYREIRLDENCYDWLNSPTLYLHESHDKKPGERSGSHSGPA